MTILEMTSRCTDSRELRLLRQDNLPFFAEIAARAFRGAYMSEVPIEVFLRIVDEVKTDMVSVGVDHDFTRPAKHYLELMLGKRQSYDRTRVEPWVGTDIKGDKEVVILLEPASRVLRFLRDLDSEQSFLAISSLSSLSERILRTTARLSGDAEQQIHALEARRNEIEIEIAHLKSRGATPLTPLERQTEIHAVMNDISQIKAGFSAVPAAKRRIKEENQEIYLESEKPVAEVLDLFFERQRAWEESPECAVLEGLRDLHVNIEKGQRLRASLEAVVNECRDLLGPQESRDIVAFLPDMLEIAAQIGIEVAQIWRGVGAYIRNPNYAARREDARVLREARQAASRIRNEIRPSPRDARLRDLGLKVTLPLRTHPVTDLKLTLEPPEAPKPPADLLRPAEAPDAEASRQRIAREKARSQHLSSARIKARIAEAMGEDDGVTLSDVIRRFPLRYGRHEISRYLSVAASEHPSVLIEGLSFVVRMRELGRVSVANIPNPIFRRSGPIGVGFGEFPTIDYLLRPEELRRVEAGIDPIDHKVAPRGCEDGSVPLLHAPGRPALSDP